MAEMNIEWISVNEVTPYTKNAKKHDKHQIEKIAKSIQQFGWKQNLVIDSNGVLVVGHGRFEAAKLLGLKEVPCVRADDLTEDEIKAYRIIDNRISSDEYDLSLEFEELQDIELDMSEFDFSLPEIEFQVEEKERQHQQNIEDTRFSVRNILNLEKGQFLGTGKYDMPIIEPVTELPDIKEWISFNYVLSDKNPEGKAVHFFIDDYQFERVFNQPEKYVDKLKQYVCVATPDFSPYGDMPLIAQMWNHYRKQWVGAWLQHNGVTVIPTVRCSTDERSLEWYLDGIPKGGIVIMSSMRTSDENTADISKKEYQTMKKIIKPCKVFIYGKETGNMGITKRDNVEYIKNFTSKRWENNG
jgi:hypothetical protein